MYLGGDPWRGQTSDSQNKKCIPPLGSANTMHVPFYVIVSVLVLQAKLQDCNLEPALDYRSILHLRQAPPVADGACSP